MKARVTPVWGGVQLRSLAGVRSVETSLPDPWACVSAAVAQAYLVASQKVMNALVDVGHLRLIYEIVFIEDDGRPVS